MSSCGRRFIRFAVKSVLIFACTVIRNVGCRMPLGLINYTRVFGDVVITTILVLTFPAMVSAHGDRTRGNGFKVKEGRFR